MASRSKPDRRPERGSDSMEAIKPLIVLVLFGTILYGAYSVVQKGPPQRADRHANASGGPAPSRRPAVEIPHPDPARWRRLPIAGSASHAGADAAAAAIRWRPSPRGTLRR